MSISPFKSDCLKGKRALVTGGGSGIGFEIARQLGLHGASVVIMGRRLAVLEKSVESFKGEGIKASFVRGDVRNTEDCVKAVHEAVEFLGGLDILVNNAAGNFLTPAEVLTPKGFKTVMDIDAGGTFNMASAAFQSLRESKGCITSISATLHWGATWFQTHAAAAKAAVDSVTRSLALEWGDYGIRVNAIAPGPIKDTPGMSKFMGDTDGMDKFVSAGVPLGRQGEKWEIALAVVFLASSAGQYISGQAFAVDGAHWLWKPSMTSRETITEFSRDHERKVKQEEPPKRSKL